MGALGTVLANDEVKDGVFRARGPPGRAQKNETMDDAHHGLCRPALEKLAAPGLVRAHEGYADQLDREIVRL